MSVCNGLRVSRSRFANGNPRPKQQLLQLQCAMPWVVIFTVSPTCASKPDFSQSHVEEIADRSIRVFVVKFSQLRLKAPKPLSIPLTVLSALVFLPCAVIVTLSDRVSSPVHYDWPIGPAWRGRSAGFLFDGLGHPVRIQHTVPSSYPGFKLAHLDTVTSPAIH